MKNWYFEEQLPGLRLAFKIKKKVIERKSKFQNIEVIDTNSHGRLLSLDGMIMLTECDEFIYHEMMSHVPLFLLRQPKKILIIGGGDGGIVRECLKHTSVQQIDLCEIDEDVIIIAKEYLKFTGKYLNNSKVNIIIEDGFKFLKRNKIKYDAIIIDSMDPKGIAKELFSRQFFELSKKNLNRHGILCAQCESPFFYSATITSTSRILSSIFSNTRFYCAPIPTYPFGFWCFVIAYNSYHKFQKEKFLKLQKRMNCKYFDADIHDACFQLPVFLKKLIHER